jgi:hypothetical protein
MLRQDLVFPSSISILNCNDWCFIPFIQSYACFLNRIVVFLSSTSVYIYTLVSLNNVHLMPWSAVGNKWANIIDESVVTCISGAR